MCISIIFVACSKTNNLSNTEVASILNKSIVDEQSYLKIPIGTIWMQIVNQKVIKNLRICASNGLILVEQIPYDYNNTETYGDGSKKISISTKGSQYVDKITKFTGSSFEGYGFVRGNHENDKLANFKIKEINITRIVSINDIKDDNSSSIPKKIALAEFELSQSKLGKELSGGSTNNIISRGRVRAKMKYDEFDKIWKVEAFDLGNESGWFTNNINI